MARQSPLFTLTGARPGHWLLAAAAAIAAIARLLMVRWRGAAPIVFAVLFTAGAAAQLQLGARLQSDGFYYFSYLRSIAFDRDLEFSNDYRLLGLGGNQPLFQPTPTGYAQSAWTIGPAIVWAPFFGAGHLVALRLSGTDPNVTANGVSFPYRQAVCLAGLVYGLLGCWFCYRAAARLIERRVAGIATVVVVSGSFMLWYIVKEPTMTHAPSMAAVAGFVWGWLATAEKRSHLQWALLGALAGLMTLIRWQNALFAVLPACDAISAIAQSARRNDRHALLRTVASGAIFTACATLAFLPQMIAWKAIYGSWLAVSPLGPQIRWFDPQIVDILWSSRNGLLSWSPALYAGAVGLIMFAMSRPAAGVPMLVALALMTYFNASIQDWWGSAGFGGRRFDGTIPFFVIGLGAFTAAAVSFTRRHPLRIVTAAAAVLVLWNLTLMNAAQDGIVRIGEPISFGDTSAAQARALHRWIGNPFTYPASLAFALRNGLPPSQYDLLSGNRFLGDMVRPYGRVDVGTDDEWVIQGGWHDAEREGTTSFRWAATPASLFIPLHHGAALKVQIRLHAFGYPGAPPQTMTLVINGHAQPPVTVSPAWETVELDTDKEVWRGGVNRVRFEFAWASRPMDVGMGGDARPLAAAVDYVRVAIK